MCKKYTWWLTVSQSIKEDRSVTREKYAELKLQGQFIKVSPGYLVADAHNLTVGIYSSNRDIAVTPVLGDIQGLNTTLPNSTATASLSAKHRSTKGKDSTGSFFIVRHTHYASQDNTPYTLRLPTSAGVLSIPQLGGSLTLDGRDSKIHVVDYPLGKSGFGLLYSTAEVFTWKQYGDKTVLVLYGGSNDNEMHEVAVKVGSGKKAAQTASHEGAVEFHKKGENVVFQWQVSPQRKVVQIGDLVIYLLSKSTPTRTIQEHNLYHLTSRPFSKLTDHFQTATQHTTTGPPSSPPHPTPTAPNTAPPS
jgi:hypothetical protein